MTFNQLEQHWQRYKLDKEYTHRLFEACVSFAKGCIERTNPDSEDIARDAAWSAWTRFNTLPDGTLFAPWFCRVVKNKQRDYHRKESTRDRYEACDLTSNERAFTLEEKQTLIALTSYHTRQLILAMLDGASLAEAAEQSGMSPRTARTRLKKLRKEIIYVQ